MFQNFKKFLKYSIVGIVNTIITYPAFIFLSNIIDYTFAIIIIFPLGVLLSYFLNKKFVFNKEKGNMLIFFIIMTIMFLTNFSTTWILVESGCSSIQKVIIWIEVCVSSNSCTTYF